MSGALSSAAMMNSVGVGSLDDAFSSMAANGAANATSNAASPVPFSGVLKAMVAQTSALDDQAAKAVTGVMDGQGVDIHDAMIATQKADMAFQLALEVRNKAVGAYQQMMGMQF